MDKLPPIEKIYEAYSAIADRRIAINEDHAVVISSSGSKEYTVSWNGSTYASNDNGTYWQGYPGYPVIAVLMQQKKLPLDLNIASNFAGVNWTELNTRYKRDYSKAAATVMDSLQCSGDEKEQIQAEVLRVYESMKLLDIQVKRGSSNKPKKG
ncbi:MAG: hypothetical protein K0R19_2045 [Bacillota bacterium]|nr:hypothetical protein [Bacillota bacterium]